MQPTIEARAERLLTALAGVVSARVVANEAGRLAEIHILASPEFHPKQIVRNVESALSAGLAVLIDRRVVSVAQLRSTAAESYLKNRTLPAAQSASRLVFLHFDTTSASSLDTSCTVTLRRGDTDIIGGATGLNTLPGRADAAARAVFNALHKGGEPVGLEGAAIVEMQGRSFVLVSARAVTGRSTRLLTGIAAMLRSPEEAAIFASLQATNRFVAH